MEVKSGPKIPTAQRGFVLKSSCQWKPNPIKFMQYKILIVEDDEDTAEIEAISLKELGFLVEVVTNGDHALPKMKTWNPDILILDLELPGKNGVEILQEMAQDSE